MTSLVSADAGGAASRSPARAKAGRGPRPSPTLLIIVSVLALAGCQGRSAPVVLDEAFAAARPGLASELCGLQKRPLGRGGAYAVTGLDRGAEALVEEARKAGYAAAAPGRGAIVTSPLLAAALVAGERALSPDAGGAELPGIQALGGLRLVVPEWRGSPQPQIVPVSTDPVPAFEAAGRAAGAFIAALRASGQAGATAGVLFRRTPARGNEALDAFSRGFAAKAGSPPAIEVLGAEDTMDDSGIAITRLLAADLRVVLVATGRDAGAACTALDRPGLAIGLEGSDPADWKDAAFAIVPDDRGLALAAVAEARGLGEDPAAQRAPAMVPALLMAYPRSGSFAADGTGLGRLLAGEGARSGRPAQAGAPGR